MKRSELQRGIEHELEHTRDRRIARQIAEDHLREHPDYYSRLERCFVKKNPGAKIVEQYQRFHGHAPDQLVEMTQIWVPGEMVHIGHGVDVGYGVIDRYSSKNGHYVHDFGAAVRVYRRPRRGEKGDKSWKQFPTELMVLGSILGFSYIDKRDGETYEIKGSKTRRLAVTPNKKTLVVVGKDGVEFVLEGGKMRVTDWIRD